MSAPPVAPGKSRLSELAEQGALELRKQVNDFIKVLALPEAWRAQAPHDIAAGLLDLLVRVGRLDVAYLRIEDPDGDIAERFPSDVRWEELAAAASHERPDGPPLFTLPTPNPLGRTEVRLLAVTPLGERGQVIVGSWRVNFPTPNEELLVRTAVDQAALAMQSSRQLRAQQRLAQERVRLEQVNSALTRLHALADRLSRARTSRDVAEIVVTEGRAALSASSGAAYLLDDGGSLLRCAHASGAPSPDAETSLLLMANSPAALCTRMQTPLFGERVRVAGIESDVAVDATVAAIPLVVEGRTLGAITLTFRGQRAFESSERNLLVAIGHQAAQAFDRARLLELEQRARLEAEARQRRAALLSEVSALLGTSLEAGTRAAPIAELAATWVDVCLLDLHSVSDEARVDSALARADRGGRATAVRSDAAALSPPTAAALVRDLSLRPTSDDGVPGHLRDRLIAEGVRCAVVAPIAARGRAFGTIVLGSFAADSLQRHDLELAVELARRIGLAMDNERLFRDARTADRRKEEFLAMLGHELRNPLAPIRTAVQLMRMRGGGAFERERGIIERQVDHMVTLVDDLLDVSRITRGKIELKRERVEIAGVLGRAVEMISPMMERSAHHLIVSCADPLLAVTGDQARLAQIVGNLLHNAAKYTPRGGRISLSAARDGEHAVIRVRDNGIGISPQLLAHVFELFVQDHRALDRAEGGLGLGLAIVQSLVQLHGGEVRAHSKGVGAGSEFTVRLPAIASAPEAQRPVGATLSVHEGSALTLTRILVVDDNVDAAEMLAELLETSGFAARIAFDGPTALELAQEFRPAVALVDIGLPVMDGFELATRLRRDHPHLRIVAVTGYGQDTDRSRSRKAGFEAHLVKPIDFDFLLELLRAPAGRRDHSQGA